MNKTERFREIARKYVGDWGDDGPYAWYETKPGTLVVDGHEIEVIESTNFNADETYAGPDRENIWVIVKFEDELYRLEGIYDSWTGTEFEDWERVELRPVTTMEYVEVDK